MTRTHANEPLTPDTMQLRHCLLALVLLSLCLGTTCRPPKPPAPGQDGVVINAERAQITSLAAFEQLNEWEFTHRAQLPARVTAAVDDVREDFPPLWRASRTALAEYQAARPPDAGALEKITAALNGATVAMNALNASGHLGDVVAVTDALRRLNTAVRQLTQPTTP